MLFTNLLVKFLKNAISLHEGVMFWKESLAEMISLSWIILILAFEDRIKVPTYLHDFGGKKIKFAGHEILSK